MKNKILNICIILTIIVACKNEPKKVESTEAKPEMTEQDYSEMQMKKNTEIINKYVADNKLDTAMTESGLVYTKHKSIGKNRPHNDDSVMVKYVGKFTDGRIFDQGTYTFVLGVQQVIRGWDEGILLLHEGEKMTMVLPFWLGYGNAESGPIPPFSVLVFDVELVKIIPHKEN